ncbi:chloride channel [Obelidium mucronatum]|nr:chloride channel [Obelidium mucronatum]
MPQTLLRPQTPNQQTRFGLSRRSAAYEEYDESSPLQRNKASINSQRNGLRDWYPDYSSIDWIHDSLKERIRIRALRALGGLSGAWENAMDSLQGWFLLFITGLTIGAIASAIDVGESLLLTWRDGFCSAHIWTTKERCCAAVPPPKHGNNTQSSINPFATYYFPLPPTECANWVSWSDALGPTFDQQFYAFSAIFLSLIAVLITNMSAVVRVDPDTGKRSVKYQAAGGGIAEVKTILGGFVIRGYLGIKTLLTKVIGLIFCISSGIMLGQQGPLVHISCCVGNIYSRLFLKYAKNEGKRREILSAASAAGVSVAFAAPIGGVLFSLEEVSYYFPDENNGIYGALFIKITSILADIRRSKYFPFHPVVEVVLVAFVTAVVNQQTPLMRLSLNELKESLFSECIPESDDPYGLCNTFPALFMFYYVSLYQRHCFILFSFGIRVPGGIVGSSMLVGACMGRIVGVLILELQQLKCIPTPFGESNCATSNDCVTPGIYALVGSAAALCGVTRMTVSLVVVMVEAHWLESWFRKWTADSIIRDSTYDSTIKRNGYPYLDHKREHHPPRGSNRSMAFAGDVAEFDTDAAFQVDMEYTWQEIQDKLKSLAYMDDGGFAVLDGQTLLGYVAYQDVKHATSLSGTTTVFYFRDPSTISCISSSPDVCQSRDSNTLAGQDLTPWMDQAPLTVSCRASMDLMLELFMKVGCKTVCVVDGAGGGAGRYRGVLTKKRVIAWLKEG